MTTYIISADEQAQLDSLLLHITETYTRADDEAFLQSARLFSGDLPQGIKAHLHAFKNGDFVDGVIKISGFKDQESLPLTPETWHPKDTYTPNIKSDFLSVILTSVLGDPFGFETQQEGKLIHDIVPIKGMEYYQAGCSSLGQLSFHTEDAFHPHRGEYLVFNCLKNPSDRGTSCVSVNQLKIPSEIKALLLQKRFYTLPDNTHGTADGEKEFHGILFGNPQTPYIRLDPDFCHARENDAQASHALEYIIAEINDKMTDISLLPGDFCFIDNFKCVHGRKPFVASFDGNDRWLKRLNVTTDLKKSAAYRQDKSSRLIGARIFSSCEDGIGQ